MGTRMDDNIAVLPSAIAETLTVVCDIIIPADDRSGSASDAQVVEFLRLLASQSKSYYRQLVGGVIWLDSWSSIQYGNPFRYCRPAEQMKVVTLIAFRKHGDCDPGLLPGIQFFAFLRRMTLNAFYTSRIGIADLDYRGNKIVSEFAGCPVDVEALAAPCDPKTKLEKEEKITYKSTLS